MTNDAMLVLQSIFQVIWRLFTSWYIPGTDGVTPAMAALFFVAAGIGLKFVLRLLGISPDTTGGLASLRSASDNIAERRGNPRL